MLDAQLGLEKVSQTLHFFRSIYCMRRSFFSIQLPAHPIHLFVQMRSCR